MDGVATAVEFLEDMRWNGKISCPHCGDLDVYMMKDHGRTRVVNLGE